MDTQQTKEEVKKKIDIIFEKIESLQARANEVTEDMRGQYHHQLENLKKEKAVLEAKYEAFKSQSDAKIHEAEITGKSAWADFKRGFKKLFGILE